MKYVAGIAALVILCVAAQSTAAADSPQFRGPNRDGKSADTGLLEEWPAKGPTLLWERKDLGAGYASVAVVGDMVYTTGVEGSTGVLYALDLDGDVKWKKRYGRGWSEGRPGSRSTPTVHDGLIYVLSGYARVACLDAATGARKWSVDAAKEFGARNLRWGITESLLIDGDNVICTPGGEGGTIVALDRKSGKTRWICRELTDKSAYCSPVIIEHGGRRLLVTLTAKELVALNPETGKVVWRHKHDAEHGIHAVSPVHEGGRIYITSGYGGVRGEMLELSGDGTRVEKKWTDGKLDCHHGGVIVHNGYVFGASDRNVPTKWLCLDLKTGKVVAEVPGVGKGSITYADGKFYVYGENGSVGLMNAAPSDFRLISSFKITQGENEHWAHPVVAAGRLFIRHGSALMAYDVKAGL